MILNGTLIVLLANLTTRLCCPSSSDAGDDLRNRGSDSTVGTESAAQPGVNQYLIFQRFLQL